MTDSHHTKNDQSHDDLLAEAVAALPEGAVPANPDLHEWFIERRGLVYRCAMLRKTAHRQVETANRMHRWETIDVWKVSLLIPKQHPLAMRYSMARVEGAQKRKQRVEAKLQSLRPHTSVTVRPSRMVTGALVVSLGSEDDQLKAALVVADYVDKLAECM